MNGDAMSEILKKWFYDEDGSVSFSEGVMFAFLAVAAIVAANMITFHVSSKPQRKSITIEDKWPGLPPREPIGSFHPLRD